MRSVRARIAQQPLQLSHTRTFAAARTSSTETRSRPVSTCDSVRHGAHVTGSDAPKITTTGTPKAAAICAGPLSFPRNRAAPEMRLFTRVSGSFLRTRNSSNGAVSSPGPARKTGSIPSRRATSTNRIGRPGFIQRRSEGMNHGVRGGSGRGLRIETRSETRSRNLRPRNAQPEHGGGQMFRGMHAAFDAQDFLSPRNPVRVDNTAAMMREPGTQSRSQRQQHAPRPAVKIDRQIRAREARPDFVDVRIAFKHGRESRLHHHGDAQVRPVVFEQRERGRGQHAVAQRPQTDHLDPRAGRQPLQGFLHAYSSIRASSTSITGMSSRIGYTRLHWTHLRPLSSCLSSRGALQSGQTRISNRSLLMAITL